MRILKTEPIAFTGFYRPHNDTKDDKKPSPILTPQPIKDEFIKTVIPEQNR